MKLLAFALLACFLSSLQLATAENATKGYIFTAPKKIAVNEIARGCLSLHNLELPAHVLLELRSHIPFYASENATEKVLASTSSVITTKGTESCLELLVPYTDDSQAALRLQITLENDPSYSVNNSDVVDILHDSLLSFVETDKPTYKPGQEVNIRILILRHDLKPWKEVIPNIWIETPSQVRVAQWSNVSMENGMVQLMFPLSPEPILGTWQIKLEKTSLYSQLIHTTTFDVKEYVLPRFEVSIQGPKKILMGTENVTWNICAKYTYGQPVKGKLELQTTGTSASSKVHPDINVDSKDGCTEFVVQGTELGIDGSDGLPYRIVLVANFTEAGTDVKETATNEVLTTSAPVELESSLDTFRDFKPALPYHVKIKATRFDGTAAAGEEVEACVKLRAYSPYEEQDNSRQCRNFTASTNGEIEFTIPSFRQNAQPNIELRTTKATAKYKSTDKYNFLYESRRYHSLNPWKSPSQSYLDVRQSSEPVICGKEQAFNVMYTLPENSSYDKEMVFHYSVKARGELLSSNSFKYQPSSNDLLNYEEITDSWNIEDTQDEPAIRAHTFPLNIKITASMSPSAKLLIYYVRENGEVVAASYTIKVGRCFDNKVESSWEKKVQTPGGITRYNVEAAPWSLCGISAVDKSTLLLGHTKKNRVDADEVFEQLEKFETRHYPRWRNRCYSEPFFRDYILRRRRTAIRYPPFYNPYNNFKDAETAFEEFGALVMTDLTLKALPCVAELGPVFRSHSGILASARSPFGMNLRPEAVSFNSLPALAAPNFAEADYAVSSSQEPVVTLRSYFPETWLWQLEPTGKDGKVTIERTLPHTITDWVANAVCVSPTHGLGISETTTVTAFQPFFLDYTLPYSVKRGEILRMKVSLFNYMQDSLPVKIKLEDAKGFDLSSSQLESSYCVDSRGNVVHEFILKPQELGDVNVTVSAAVDHEYSTRCGPETIVFTSDTIVKPILVLPEGFPKEVTHSAFLCPKDSVNETTVSWPVELPSDLVPGSERAFVTAVGDVLGPVFENLDHLVRVPIGCGEQNMILFVPNIQAIRYLDAARISNPALRRKAIKNMETGYQRELRYRHRDGSYSAFGSKDDASEGSIWLTAFVVKSFAQARHLIRVDEHDLKFSVDWIVKKQLDNGCFPAVGTVFHEGMKGGLESDKSTAPLTAYILISLIETGVTLPENVVEKALSCLEADLQNSNSSTYATALYTYALTLLGNPKAADSMRTLLSRATENDNLIWWENKPHPVKEVSVEMTAYAILSLMNLGGDANIAKVLKAVRWLSTQRNSAGGFTSTQDTVLGLEALSRYAALITGNNTDVSVLVNAGNLEHLFKIENGNRLLVNEIRLPALPTTVEITAEGDGCVLVQCTTKYNVANAAGSEAFDLTVSTSPDKSLEGSPVQKIRACTRYKIPGKESNMALLEVGMISGYVPHRASLVALTYDSSSKVKRFEVDNGVVTIYFEKLTNEERCLSFLVKRKEIVDNAEPANVKVYDYYRQELTTSTNYNFGTATTAPN